MDTENEIRCSIYWSQIEQCLKKIMLNPQSIIAFQLTEFAMKHKLGLEK